MQEKKCIYFSTNDQIIENEYCQVLESSVTEFKDYNEFLGNFYCNLKVVLKHHIFECRRNEKDNILFESQQGEVDNSKKKFDENII